MTMHFSAFTALPTSLLVTNIAPVYFFLGILFVFLHKKLELSA